jgi:hypothetical protein
MIFKLFTVFVFSFVIFDIRFVRGWEDSLKHISGRDVNAVDPAHGIVDIQQYYREIFENDNWEDLDENEVKEQSESMKVYEKIVPGRYSVIFYQHTPDEIIDKTVTLLKDAHERTDGKLKASHFVHLKHAAKGFFATLSEKLVNVVGFVLSQTIDTLVYTVFVLWFIANAINFMCSVCCLISEIFVMLLAVNIMFTFEMVCICGEPCM